MSSQVADLTTVFVAERSRLHRLIERIIGDRAATEDIVQEAYVKVSNAVKRTVIDDHRGYLVRTATNLAFDYQRHLSSARPATDSQAELLKISDHSARPDADFANRQALMFAQAALNRLPPRTRLAFELHRLQEKKLAQIAKEMGVSTALVHKLVTEAYTAVRDELQSGGFLESSEKK